MMTGNGHLVLVVGPSGAGKDSVMMGARARLRGNGGIVFPRRFVTRLSNPDAEDHVSMSEMEFAVAVADGAFALWWRAHGNSYGIGRFIESHLESGATVVVNCSRASVADARSRFANVTVVEIIAPDEVLVQRIVARGRETADEARQRVQRRVPDYPPGTRLARIVNDRSLDEAVAAFCSVLQGLAATRLSAATDAGPQAVLRA